MSSSSLGQKIIQGSSAGVLATIVHLLSRLLLVPIILHFVPLAHYGLWALCFILLSYVGMSAFGLQNTYVRYGAFYLSKGDMETLNSLMSTGLTLMGILSLIVFLALLPGVPLVMDLFSVAQARQDLARFMILGTAAAFLIELWLGAFKNLLEGMQEIALTRMVWLSATLLEVVLVVAFLLAGMGIMGVVYAYVIKTVWEIGTDMVLAFRKLPGLRIRPQFVQAAFEALFVFGGKVQLLGMVGIFLNSFDRLMTTALVGLEATGLFEVGRKLPFTARGVAGAALAPFLPAASSMDHTWENSPWPGKAERMRKYGALGLLALTGSALVGLPWCVWQGLQGGATGATLYFWAAAAVCLALISGPGWRVWRWWQRTYVRQAERLHSEDVRRMYLQGSRNMIMINGVVYVFLLAAASELLTAWVGPGYEQGILITRIIAVATFIHLGTGVGTSIFKGLNRVGRELEYMLIQLVLALIWIPVLTWMYGLYGAVVGYAISVVPASVFFILRSNLALGVPHLEYCRTVGPPLVVPAVLGSLVFFLLQALPPMSRWGTAGEVLVVGGVYVVLSLLCLRHWILTSREWSMLVQALPGTGKAGEK